MAPTARALVLGGGGIAGIAWEIGLVTGLADAGVDLRHADTIVGTSAGATVAAQITSGRPLGDLFARQVEPAGSSTEMAVAYDPDVLTKVVAEAVRAGCSGRQVRQRVGRFALDAVTPDQAVRRQVVAARLPSPQWPESRVLLTAVDTESGELVVFDRDGGVSLVDAVTASSAVPGVWPPVTIDGRRYTDGGIRSLLNVDLVAGTGRVLALAPMPDEIAELEPELTVATERLTAAGHLLTVTPDHVAQAVFDGDVLDPASCAPAAEAGRAQGRAEAARISEFWQD